VGRDLPERFGSDEKIPTPAAASTASRMPPIDGRQAHALCRQGPFDFRRIGKSAGLRGAPFVHISCYHEVADKIDIMTNKPKAGALMVDFG